MTNGCFDILHPGHIDYIEKARTLGDQLVVAVNDDAFVRRLKGGERPVNPLATRLRMLSALSCV
jgi:D-beta-D-heptose 7-phosphate kinase / D-beta-D-heptose 1-phosphate adenosyltransferase